MERFEIEVTTRNEFGKSAANRMRKAGFLPANVYSAKDGAKGVTISDKQFRALAQKSRQSQLFILKSNDTALNGRLAIVKEVQKNFLKNMPKHVDFQVLRDDEEITVRVSLKIVGESTGVKNDGGVLTQMVHDLGVRCLPGSIPNEVEINIAALKVGESLHAKDITLPSGVKLADDADETLLTISAAQSQVEETAVAAIATPDAAAAAGATPAAGAAAAPAADAKAAAAPAKDAKKK